MDFIFSQVEGHTLDFVQNRRICNPVRAPATFRVWRWITINSRVNLCDMEGGKEALEDFAREAVALYGRAAPKMLLRRAEIADLYGDPLAATWREAAAIASRITRRTDDPTKPSPVRPQPSPAPHRIGERSHVLRNKRGQH